jgi:hypothetical protein
MRTLADRYTLQDRVLDGPGWAYWCGHDGVLHRSVGILDIGSDHPREPDVLAAARAAAAAEDPRIQRVLDILSDDEGTCLVIEWVAATSLEDLLGNGPLPDTEALRITLDVASALAIADLQGLHHGSLGPHWILRADDGRIRVGGLCVAGALAGYGSPHRGPGFGTSAADAQRLGAVLYAAMTGRWPLLDDTTPAVPADGRTREADRPDPVTPAGSVDSGLPEAPTQGGRPVRARMVRAGVPSALDDVAARALGLSSRGEPLTTPAEVAMALRDAARRMGDVDLDHPSLTEDDPPPGRVPVGGRPGIDQRHPPRSRMLTVALVALLVVLALVAGALLVGDALGRRDSTSGPPSSGNGAAPSASAASPPEVLLPIKSITTVAQTGHQRDDAGGAYSAVDHNIATAWHTLDYYGHANLGNGTKKGIGLLLDLGALTHVDRVTLYLVGSGTSVELRASVLYSPSYLSYVGVASAADAGPVVTLLPPGPDWQTRYLLVWLTKLPQVPSTNGHLTFSGGIREIQVYGG